MTEPNDAVDGAKGPPGSSTPEHYLKRELYELVGTDPSIFEFLQSGSLDGIWYWDLEDPEREWMSPQFWEVLGYDPSEKEHLASEWQDLIHPEDLQVALENCTKHFEDPSHPYDQIVRYRHRDGSTVWVRCRGLAIRDESGKPIRMLGAHNEITQIKEAELELEARQEELVQIAAELEQRVASRTREASEAEDKYKRIFENAVEGIYQTTVDGRFLSANRAMAELLGYDSPQALIDGVGDIAARHYVDPSVRARFVELLEVRGVVSSFEAQVRRTDGTLIWTLENARVVRDSSGTPEYFEGCVEDITEWKRLEDHLRESQKMEALGQVTAGIAHDFNNLLTVIQVNAGLLARSLRPDDSESHTLAAELVSSAESGRELVGKLSDFSRRGGRTLVPLDLWQVLRDAVPTLRRLLPEHIDVQVSVESPGPVVMADPGSVQQILMNLATNARDAMPTGGSLRISGGQERIGEYDAALHDWVSPGDFATIAVSDTGTGMNQGAQRRLFEPFYTTKPAGKGTGLGMAVVYGLMKSHGGMVHLFSDVGRGTMVRLYFPITDEAAVQAAPPEPPVQREIPMGSETVLLVEDDDALRAAAERSLKRLGYEVYSAADGEAGLKEFSAHQGELDLVLTDLVMPKLGGRGIFAALQEAGSTVPIIIMSGHTDPREFGKIRSDGPVPFLQKPWTIEELAQIVRDVLDSGR